MKIVLPDGSRRELNGKFDQVIDILKILEINPVEVIVARNGRIVTEEEAADDGDEIKIIRVVHGG